MSAGKFIAQFNEALVWQSADGREAVCSPWPDHPLGPQLFIFTDIHRSPVTSPQQAVGFTSAALRQLADRLDELATKQQGSTDG